MAAVCLNSVICATSHIAIKCKFSFNFHVPLKVTYIIFVNNVGLDFLTISIKLFCVNSVHLTEKNKCLGYHGFV